MVAERRAQARQRRVFPLRFEHQELWIKCAATPHLRSRVGFRMLGALAFLTRREILKPRTNPGGVTGLRHEAQILMDLHERGVAVPRVIASAADGTWIALSAMGESLGRRLATTQNPKQRRRFLIAAAEALASLHAQELVHGAPLPRNILVEHRGESLRFGFLDFEDYTATRMNFARAAARDFALLLWGSARWSRDDATLLTAMLATWRATAPASAVSELAALARFAERVRTPLKPCLRWLGGDLRRAALALDAVKRDAVPLDAVQRDAAKLDVVQSAKHNLR